MFKKLGFVTTLIIVFIGMSMLAVNIRPVRAEPRTWTVDDDGPADFHTIQEAVNAASLGDTAFVHNGTYHEDVLVNKTGISLIGENTYTTTIDGNVNMGDMYHEASYVTLASFSIDGRVYIGASSPGYGPHHDDIIRENFIKGGVSVTGWTKGSPYNISINENEIVEEGVGLVNCSGIVVCNNTIEDTDVAVTMGFLFGGDHRFHHNTFINNTKVLETAEGQTASYWDDGYPSGGNYWSDYNDTDSHWSSGQNETGSDGIGDTAYEIDANNTDRYPLMAPFNTFDAGTWNGASYNVDVISNSTISDFDFHPEEGAFLQFNVTGEDGTNGFCRVTIPIDLLWVDGGWTITVGDQSITDYRTIPDGNFAYLYFSYNHSTQMVIIQGTHVIPEFPSFAILPLLMILTIFTVALIKKRLPRKP